MRTSDKQLILSITAKDCVFTFYRGSGKGGQKRNKTSSACRCQHPPSNAIGACERYRSQQRNKEEAFSKMASSKKFQTWLKIEVAKKTGLMDQVLEQIERDLNDPKKIKVETKQDGRWKSL